MGRNDDKTQHLYDLQMKVWKKSLDSIARKMSRRLDGDGLKYSLKHRVKQIGSLREKRHRTPMGGRRRKEKVKDLLNLSHTQ